LATNSPVFTRLSSSGNFCYVAIQVNVLKSGVYTFQSNSTLDTYGYLYKRYFDPSYTIVNLLRSNDDSGSNRQFLIEESLQWNETYILVVTTFSPRTYGSVTIMASGAAAVTFALSNETTNTTPQRRTTTTTLPTARTTRTPPTSMTTRILSTVRQTTSTYE
jgi:hypothetical protein